MNLGLRTILLLAAVVLFVISVFVDTPSDWWAWGLAAFAGAFLSDALGYADRTFNSARGSSNT